jgi:hypothetical protein
MATKPDLNKLKTEIASRRKEKNIAPDGMGEQNQFGASPRDTFLYGLIESLKTGRDTASSNLVKIVDNQVAVKKKETTRLPINETVEPQHPQQQHPQQQRPQQHPVIHEAVDMSPERDELLYKDLENKRKQTLAEAISAGIVSNKGMNTGISSYNPNSGQPMQINEGYLVENVKKIVDNYLIDNFGPVVEEAIKGTIIEMYAVERIKEVLQENREMIKTLVYETIREIQAKSKAKTVK